MKYISLSILVLFFVTACNTVGGIGRDISEAGDHLDQAAGWSQNQINNASEWTDQTLSE